DRLGERLRLAGLESITPGTFVAVSLLIVVLVGSLTLALVPVWAIAAAGGAAAGAVPFTVVSWRARQRRRHLRTVWPDVVDHLVSAVRSGMALPDGLAALAEVGPVGTRRAFAL